MGGRGSASRTGGGSGLASLSVAGIGGGAGVQQNNIANQAPNASNTPVTPNGVSVLSKMSDDQLASLALSSRHVDMPNHLSDVDDRTQKFVYAAGLNEKPQVLDQASFDQYLRDNNISRSEVLARTVGSASYNVGGVQINLTSGQVTSMIKDSDLTYVGGKFGGKVHGAGTYFDMNGGRQTGYGGGRDKSTCIACLSKNARVVDEYSLDSMSRRFAQTHPKFARAVGGYSRDTMSIYALAQGYNVIRYGSYHNVIERSALVVRQNDL